MKYNLKKLSGRAFCILSAINLMIYALAHASYLTANDTAGAVIEYIAFYVFKCADFLIPAVIALIGIAVYAYLGFRAAFGVTLVLSLSRLFYTVPYYYIIFIYNHGFDSLEAISIALIASAGVILFTLLSALVSGKITFMIAGGRRADKRADTKSYMKEKMRIDKMGSYLSDGNLPALFISAVYFVTGLIGEIIDTVSFFIEYASDFRGYEILTIVANYLLLFALLIGGYILLSTVGKMYIKKHLAEENNGN